MPEIRKLDPHAPLPDGLGRHVIVFTHFDHDDPRRAVTDIILANGTGPSESTRPMRPDGTSMSIDEAVEAALRVADSEGLPLVYTVDRTAGAREREILAHGGDHTFDMAKLDDMDLEDGERGPDMRRP